MSSTSGKGGGSKVWVAHHSANVRICHWINLIACGYLLVSGVHIFLDFPELYWGHTGYQGHPAIFRLSDWGSSWDEAGAMGNRMWGRNYHVTFAWVFLINGWPMSSGTSRHGTQPVTTERFSGSPISSSSLSLCR